MKLKDEYLLDAYMCQSLLYIRSNHKLCGVVDKMLLDGELYSHAVSVCKLATQLAIIYEYDSSTISDVNLTGLLHDIGKIYVPKAILYKADKLTKEEFNIIKKHSVDGYNLLRSVGVSERVSKLVLNHHEKKDGSGYPNGLKEKTELEDIITTADIFSALTEHRVYHNALSVYDALGFIGNFDNLNYDMVRVLQDIIAE